jgi:thioredoxin reductase (NADPH)
VTTVELGSANFERTILDNEIVLVDFWAAWCGPCRQFAPVFERASETHTDVVFAKVDTEAEQQLAGAAQISAIPTLMAFKGGRMVYREAGALPPQVLEQLIDAVKDLDLAELDAGGDDADEAREA